MGKAIAEAEPEAPLAAAAVRLIALMGSRRQEVVKLKRAELDAAGSCLHLGDSKAERSTRAVGARALAILKDLAGEDSKKVWLFPNATGKAPADLKKAIATIFDAAGLKDARSHALRRTFATVGDRLGYSDPIVGALLGHAATGTTQVHYVRRPDAALIAAATRISDRIASAMEGKAQAHVVDIVTGKAI